MSTNYPTSKDTLTNPTADNNMSEVPHADQHANANDAIEAIQTKVGVDSSADANSIDYKLTNASSSNPGHKHTATAVTDFDTEVSNNTDVSANTTHRSSDGKDHSDVVLNNTHRASDGKDHSDVVLNNTHRTSDGSDHTFIDQDVTSGSSPSFTTPSLTTPQINEAVNLTSTSTELNFLDGVTGADVARRYFTKIVSTDASGDYQTDGTDDHVQIQAAIDAVEAAGGGVVFLRKGTYVIGAGILVDSNNVHIMGEGMGATVIQAKAAFTTDIDLIDLSGASCSISRLTVDGNKANQTTQNNSGIYLSGDRCFARDVEVKNMNYVSGSYAAIYFDSSSGIVDSCYIRDNESYGILIGDGAEFYMQSVINSYFEGNLKQSVYLSTCYSVKVLGNHFFGNENHAIHVSTTVHSIISGNFISGSSSYPTDNTYSAIHISDTSLNNVISNNVITESSSLKSYKYGIRENSSNDDYNVISGNKIDSAQTENVSLQGANSRYIGGEVVAQMVVFDFTTDVATGDGKFYYHIDDKLNGMNLVRVHAEVITAGTTGTTDIQIYNVTQATDMLTTKITIDSGETGSDTAATPPVIDTANDDVATNDLIRIDVDAVSTTAPKGLIVTNVYRLP